MHAKIECPNCKQHVLTVELRGAENREYSAQCPACGEVNGFVVATTQEEAVQNVVRAFQQAVAEKHDGNVSVQSLAGALVGPEDPVLVGKARAASIPEKDRCPECGGTGYGVSKNSLILKDCPECGGTGMKKAA
jgi:uncharacterized Zn finger protein